MTISISIKNLHTLCGNLYPPDPHNLRYLNGRHHHRRQRLYQIEAVFVSPSSKDGSHFQHRRSRKVISWNLGRALTVALVSNDLDRTPMSLWLEGKDGQACWILQAP